MCHKHTDRRTVLEAAQRLPWLGAGRWCVQYVKRCATTDAPVLLPTLLLMVRPLKTSKHEQMHRTPSTHPAPHTLSASGSPHSLRSETVSGSSGSLMVLRISKKGTSRMAAPNSKAPSVLAASA